MAALVHQPEHRGLEIFRLIPRRYPHIIARNLDRERMGRNILPEPFLWHPEESKEFLVHLLQGIDVIINVFQWMFLWKDSLGKGLGQDLLELRDEFGEDLVKVIGGQSLLREIQERIV